MQQLDELWAERMRYVVFAVAVAAASCGSLRRSSGPAPEPTPVAPAARSAPSAVRTAASDGGAPDVDARPPSLSRRLELRDPGREPRRALRHAFAKGSRQKLRVEIETRVIEEHRVAAKAFLESKLLVTIVEVQGDGTAHFRYELGPIAVSGAGDGPLKLGSGDAGVTKLSGSAIIAAHGELLDHRPDLSASEDPPEVEVVRLLLSSVIELPLSPVGPGGRWELVLEAQSSELTITRTTSYELLGFSGSGVQIRVSQGEQVRVQDGGAMSQWASAPSAGNWLARLGRVFPEGRQTMKAAMPTETPGELVTELRLVQR